MNVTSPELTFLHLAAACDLLETVYYGHALCSSYRLDASAPGGIAQRGRDDAPLTSVEKITAFLDRIGRSHGSAKAQSALKLIRNGSRSPMESALAMLFGLPSKHGGFGLGDVHLNRSVRVYQGTDGFGKPRWGERIPDLTIVGKSRNGSERAVAIDYDSRSIHASSRAMGKDAIRRNELASSSSMIHFTVTTDQALDFAKLSGVADQVRRALGKRKSPKPRAGLPPAENRRHLELVQSKRIALWSKYVCYSAFRQME